MLERVFLAFALINGQTGALTFFSALKLATRLKHTEGTADHNKFNDYYLIGNLVSAGVAILYVYLFNHLHSFPFFARIIH